MVNEYVDEVSAVSEGKCSQERAFRGRACEDNIELDRANENCDRRPADRRRIDVNIAGA